MGARSLPIRAAQGRRCRTDALKRKERVDYQYLLFVAGDF